NESLAQRLLREEDAGPLAHLIGRCEVLRFDTGKVVLGSLTLRLACPGDDRAVAAALELLDLDFSGIKATGHARGVLCAQLRGAGFNGQIADREVGVLLDLCEQLVGRDVETVAG